MTRKNRKINIFKIAYLIYFHLPKKSKKILFFTAFIIFISGLLDLFSIGSVIPFLMVITQPSKLWEVSFFSSLYSFIGLSPKDDILFITTLFFGFATIISTFIKLLAIFINTRFAAYIGTELNMKVFNKLIYQPYEYYLNKNTSELISSMTVKLNYLVSVIYLILNALSASILIILILIFLIIYQTKIALIVGLFVFIFYSIATFVSDKKLNYNSVKISKANNNLIKVIQETIGSIKEIILMSRPSVYSNEFFKADNTLRIKSSENQFISIAPKYLVDSLGILIIAFLAFYFNLSGESNSSLITILGTFALAAQRLIPAFQTLYSAISKIRSYGQSVLDVINLIELPLSRKELKRTKDKYKMQEKIIFENVSFSYNNSKEKVLNNINLKILQGSCIGIKGSTGSGKSTLISLLIGLLPPTNGNIIIDGNYLYSKNEDAFLQKWRNSIAYVSQDSFLTDNTLLANIAFGCSKNEIDLDKVKQAASFANIDKFINSTKDGYLTFVGERGVRLSGGQKQRIAIARALYKDSEILILDEATSQLDKFTESRILNSIKNLKKIKTIIMIAHRENTFENCDYVYSLENNSLQ